MRRNLLLIAAGLVVLALPVAADRVTAAVVEHQAAERLLRCAAGLTTAPEVRVGGFPVLTQLAGRRLDEIRVRADDVPVRAGVVTTAKLTVGHVEAVGKNVAINGMSADSLTVDATVPFSGFPGLPTGAARIVGGDDAGRLVLSVTIPVRGLSLPATVYAALAVDGNRLTITPDEIELSALGLRIPASRLPATAGQAKSVDLPALPGGLTYRSVTATPDGLRIVAGGENLRLSGSGTNKCGGTAP